MQKNARITKNAPLKSEAFRLKYFLGIFWVLRTLRYQWQNCGQLRKYRRWEPGKGLCPLHSRDFLKKIE